MAHAEGAEAAATAAEPAVSVAAGSVLSRDEIPDKTSSQRYTLSNSMCL